MESCGPGIQSMERFKMDFGYFVKTTEPLKNIIFRIEKKQNKRLENSLKISRETLKKHEARHQKNSKKTSRFQLSLFAKKDKNSYLIGYQHF